MHILLERRRMCLRDKPQLMRTAHQTFHVELAKQTGQRCLAGLVIFPALKPACGIHARILHCSWDNGGPRHIKFSRMTRIAPLPFPA